MVTSFLLTVHRKITYFQDFRELQGMEKKGKGKRIGGTVYRAKSNYWFVETDLIASQQEQLPHLPTLFS